MKKILIVLAATTSIHAFADKVYLEPQYTVAIESASFESSTQNFTTKTLTPIVYEDRLLPAGESIVLSCENNKPIIRKIDQQELKIPVQLANNTKQATNCASPNLGLFWAQDEYKIKNDNIVSIDDKKFSVIPFSATIPSSADGKIVSVSSDGNLINLLVNKAKYFKKAQFYGTIDGISYLLQSSNDDKKFTVHAADLQKLLVTDENGQVLASIDFPSYE
jgi:hypothetical protein